MLSNVALLPPPPPEIAPPARILVVDDDAVLLNVVTRALTALGFQVLSAKSAEEGLERFRALRPDCAIVDVYLPGIDGFQFVERAHAIAPDVPMLMLSGLDADEHQAKAATAGARQFLHKAIDMRELARHVRDALEHPGTPSGLAVIAAETGTTADPDAAPVYLAPPLPTLDLAALEFAAIDQALLRCNGNRAQAARILGIHVRTLHRKLRERQTG